MAEADAEDRDFAGNGCNQIEADAGLFRRAGPGRKHDGFGLGGSDRTGGDLVVAMHAHLRTQFTEIVHQVEGEAVIVVDEANH